MPDLAIIPIGIFIGIVVSAPVGPVNVLCIGRALRYGFVPAVMAGVGAVIGDGVLASIAGFGIAAIAEAIEHHARLIQLVGGVILVLYGVRVMMLTPRTPEVARQHVADSALKIVPTTFLITVTNPGAILGFLAIFGALVGDELLPEGDYAAAGLLVVSVCGGAMLWWIGLSAVVARIRHLLNEATLRRINIVSGMLLAAFGALLLGRLLYDFLGL
jgi:threonine/homoserine/homoserine lactone efflux protein